MSERVDPDLRAAAQDVLAWATARGYNVEPESAPARLRAILARQPDEHGKPERCPVGNHALSPDGFCEPHGYPAAVGKEREAGDDHFDDGPEFGSFVGGAT